MQDPSTILGALALGSITLMSAALLFLRLREHLAEKPDPKLTYATQGDLQRLRDELQEHQRDAKADLADVHRLVLKNAEHIAALIAQSEFHGQRLSELTRLHH